MNFEMEVLNILDTKVCKLSEEGKSPSDKKLDGLGGPTAYKNFHVSRKRKIKGCEGSFYGTVQQI